LLLPLLLPLLALLRLPLLLLALLRLPLLLLALLRPSRPRGCPPPSQSASPAFRRPSSPPDSGGPPTTTARKLAMSTRDFRAPPKSIARLRRRAVAKPSSWSSSPKDFARARWSRFARWRAISPSIFCSGILGGLCAR